MKAVQELNLKVHRLPCRLTGDARRTIMRFFWPGEDRARKILSRIDTLTDIEVDQLVQTTVSDFELRHPDLNEILAEHYYQAMSQMNRPAANPPSRQLLIGTYFTMEYAYESTALFNPSMVPALDQTGLPDGVTRFLLSLRAVGEGHVSSIVFRQGLIDPAGQITVEPIGPHTHRLQRVENREYDKNNFRERLKDTGLYNECIEKILNRLSDQFSCPELIKAAEREKQECADQPVFQETADRVIWLARSNYQILIPPQGDIAELVIFPIAEQESQGMEDMRLVQFTEDDGSVFYFGTYTAFNGSRILPQLMVSTEMYKVEVYSLHGRFAQNKGLALFPRRIDGQYMMIGRTDGENIYLLKSKNVFNWNEGEIIQNPKYPWEFVQIGNCGPPIETPAGWLVLTHGVGPMRRYSMGAILLDRQNPAKIIGQLSDPFLVPIKEERVGYVPNVVYSCGGMLHNGLLIIPYGISDAATGFATLPLADLLTALTH
jgi:predicted GH43/DUF377 family glycosyl hydrolase